MFACDSCMVRSFTSILRNRFVIISTATRLTSPHSADKSIRRNITPPRERIQQTEPLRPFACGGASFLVCVCVWVCGGNAGGLWAEWRDHAGDLVLHPQNLSHLYFMMYIIASHIICTVGVGPTAVWILIPSDFLLLAQWLLLPSALYRLATVSPRVPSLPTNCCQHLNTSWSIRYVDRLLAFNFTGIQLSI